MTDRRQFIKNFAVGALSTVASSVPAIAYGNDEKPNYPFRLGVASGDVTSNSVVLWTRLVPEPLADDGGMKPIEVNVQWKLSSTPDMRNVIRQGDTVASADFAHSIHIDISNLDPNQTYWYQFYSGQFASQVGRTKTLPNLQSDVENIRFVTASCQNFTHGHFVAYKHIVADQPDFILHLGDYIYDKSYGYTVRKHDAEKDPETLSDFRRRHALYKTDSYLRAAHAHIPFFTMPDNHDVIYDNNPKLYAKRAAAYQAWYEHMPVRGFIAENKNKFHLRRDIQIGDLLRISLLDTRQFRDTEKLCPENEDPNFGFGIFQPLCEGYFESSRSMLGAEQEKWLTDTLQQDTSTWRSVASTCPLSPFRLNKDEKIHNYIGGWDAYSENRQRLISAIPSNRLSRTVVVSGDIHSFWAFDGGGTETNGKSIPLVEFVTSSISSDWPEPLAQPMLDNLPDNRHAKFYGPEYRGYLLHDVNKKTWNTRARAVRDVTNINSEAFDLARFEVEPDKQGLKQLL